MAQASNQTLHFFLVRHGETADNVQMRYIGMRDETLTEKGMQQAGLVAAALAQLPIRTVISSPLRRAADTAARIRSACGSEIRTDARLAEGSFGSWEGLTRAEVLKLGSRDAELLIRWETDSSCAPPGGESIESIQRRVVQLGKDLKSEFADGSIALVSHVGPIKALIAYALGMPLQQSRRLFLDPGTISVIDWGPKPLLRLFNSHAHLGWASARWMERQNNRRFENKNAAG
jgi:broad specificity phosphatase PhoE